ncbi:MAG: TIM-barrel domain-containing protein, partial [Halobacteriaceae archaeon]
SLEIIIGTDDWSFEVRRSGRTLLSEQRADINAKRVSRTDPLGFDARQVNQWPYKTTNAGTSFQLGGDEHIYGLGEKFIEFDKRGCEIECWVTQPNGAETERAYKNVPFYLSTKGYGLLVDTTQRTTFDIGATSTVTTEIQVEDDTFAYVFMAGPEFSDILETYTALTGRPGRVPKWSLGVWMSRLGYESREEVEQVTSRLRDENIPADRPGCAIICCVT